jgi:DNA-directed RNA polymerase II subunit RPB3
MQGLDDLEPTVRIRDLKKDKVNFVLENVDLAYGIYDWEPLEFGS